MRMTYRQLQRALSKLDDTQLDCDVTVEIDNESMGADFRIVGDNSETGLEVNHPVIFVYYDNPLRCTDTEFDRYLVSLETDSAFAPISNSEEN